MSSLIWIIISYLLGSIPFGYLISRFSGKNILEIGWKKTSGSNVFKNVGKWQGILTGLLDLGKGSLAVLIARQLGLSLEIQILAGTAAMIGHNWSIFLNFSGGRGIGTFTGVLLVLSPKLFVLGFFLMLLFALLWSSAIATLILFILLIVFFINPPGFLPLIEFQSTGMLAIFCLPFVLLKRLSPLKELADNQKKVFLIFTRLVFDDDGIVGLKLNKKNSKKLIKPLTNTVMVPSKFGWRAAKYGADLTKSGILAAKKGMEKYVLGQNEIVILELKVDDFKKMMIAAAKKIVIHQEDINKINVFPVADKDTGYNMAATLLGVEGTVSRREYTDFREMTEDIKDAAMVNARGNAGMIITGYFVEVLDRIKHLETIDAFHLALAMQRGIKAARLSIIEPVNGTILDTIEAAGEKAYEMTKKNGEKNIIKVLEESLKSAKHALETTPERLPILKKNNVVDAGALGYVKILEAWLDSLKGITIEALENQTSFDQPQTEEELTFRYEIVATFEKPDKFDLDNFKKEINSLGDSSEVLDVNNKVKFHIHTNKPESVIEKLKDFPGIDYRLEDMQKEKVKAGKKPLGLVVGETSNLPKEYIKEHGIEEVPFFSRFPDGEIIHSKEEIFPKMKEALETGRPLPSTSAPPFKDFLKAYNSAFERFENILVITVSSKLSGTYSSARIARSTFKKPNKLHIYVFDCFAVEIAEGLIAMKAQELIDQRKELKEVIKELEEFSPKVNLIGLFSDIRYLVKGGRFNLPKPLLGPIRLIQKLGLHLLIKLKNGEIKPDGAYFGKDMAEMVFKKIEKITKGEKIKMAIAHADNLKAAQKLKKLLEEKLKAEVLFTSQVSAVIGNHSGPGAIIVSWYLVDK
ncbi:MAG: glycerol-3-phosphate acyltransferase [bacterium]